MIYCIWNSKLEKLKDDYKSTTQSQLVVSGGKRIEGNLLLKNSSDNI
jgi:hypothetical protein